MNPNDATRSGPNRLRTSDQEREQIAEIYQKQADFPFSPFSYPDYLDFRRATTDVDGIPVFNTVEDAAEATGANTAMVFVPPRFEVYRAVSGQVQAIFADVDNDGDLKIHETFPANRQIRIRCTTAVRLSPKRRPPRSPKPAPPNTPPPGCVDAPVRNSPRTGVR